MALIISGTLVAAPSLRRAPASQLSQVIETPKFAAAYNTTINFGLPTRLQIPKLKVDTHIINVGLTKDGNMSVPSNVVDAGWYKYSKLPGNTGTAVIAGHLDGLRGEPGVFSKLSKLIPGDTIFVTEGNGLTVSFVIRKTKTYALTEQPAEVFSSANGSHLNLITCTGNWDKSEHRFAKRLVVFADKAS